jgi:hypothetical protein
MDSFFLCVVSERVLFEMTCCYVYVLVIDLCHQALTVFRYPTVHIHRAPERSPREVTYIPCALFCCVDLCVLIFPVYSYRYVCAA